MPRGSTFAPVEASPGPGVGTLTVDGGDSTPGPADGTPTAVAVLLIEPALRSAWVTLYVAVQVICWPGARVAAPAGQTIAERVPVPVNFPSVTATLLSVTFPVLVTWNEYVMT